MQLHTFMSERWKHSLSFQTKVDGSLRELKQKLHCEQKAKKTKLCFLSLSLSLQGAKIKHADFN